MADILGEKNINTTVLVDQDSKKEITVFTTDAMNMFDVGYLWRDGESLFYFNKEHLSEMRKLSDLKL